MRSLHTLPLFAVALAALSTPAFAQDDQQRPPDGDDLHTAENDIVVTAPFTRSLNLFGNVGVVEGDEIAQNLRPQIGDVLASQPGISATGFAPGASRPVIRGFQGERVRILTDGIGAADASNTSGDHAVTIDPLTAERIEVLRGPASLLFGSNAIGGAINVFDRRIPRRVAAEPVHVDALAAYGSAASERMGGASFDVAITPTLAWHVDGSYLRSSDLRIGGNQLAPGLRADLLNEAATERAGGNLVAAEAIEALANNRGRVPNSAVESWGAGTGLALINDRGALGVSVSVFDTGYGLPSRPSAEAAEELVTIGLRQWRADLRGQLDLGSGLFERARIRAGFGDYRHIEFEGEEVGTTFLNQSLEGRLELVQRERGGWSGAIGLQYGWRDFNAIGAEAFVPQNDTESFALFGLQEVRRGAFDVEFAGRWERTSVRAAAVGVNRSFDAFSGALGLSLEDESRSRIGLTLSRGARAPSAEELLSNGPHVATQSFEIGDPNFGLERVWGAELSGRLRGGAVDLSFAAYHSWFDDFIYAASTGALLDDLPVFAYRQADARIYGFEAEAEAEIASIAGFTISANVDADFVRARLARNTGDLPRIPPLSIGGGLSATSTGWTARVEAEHAFAQNRIAVGEAGTDAFTLVNASLAWRPLRDGRMTLSLSGNNLLDAVGRRHASFTKDFVPIAGRDIRLTARLSF